MLVGIKKKGKGRKEKKKKRRGEKVKNWSPLHRWRYYKKYSLLRVPNQEIHKLDLKNTEILLTIKKLSNGDLKLTLKNMIP